MLLIIAKTTLNPINNIENTIIEPSSFSLYLLRSINLKSNPNSEIKPIPHKTNGNISPFQKAF